MLCHVDSESSAISLEAIQQRGRGCRDFEPKVTEQDQALDQRIPPYRPLSTPSLPCSLSQQLDLSETLCNRLASMVHLLGS